MEEARMTLARSALVLALAFGCTASHEGGSSLDVEAAIASVTLGDACGGAGGARRPPPADGEPSADIIGDCEDGGFCGGCRSTSIQLAIDAGAGDLDVPFEVISIELLDMDRRVLDTLDPTEASLYTDDGFVSWDERVAPNDSLSVRYETTSPDWASIGDGNAWSTYGVPYRIRMRVRIDGEERTLDFSPAMREPEIVT
jgi:hypothetical protein